MLRLVSGVALCGASLALAASALAIEVGDAVPPFVLPDLLTGDDVASETLLAAHPWTLLVVWNTECPDCVSDVVHLGRRWMKEPPADIGLVGISFDDARVSDARRMVRGARLRTPQLSDRDGRVADLLDARDHSVNVFLVDTDGTLAFAHHGHPDDIDVVLETALSLTAPEASHEDD